MEPQWHQDTNTKGIQPKHLPHFEVAGAQLDWEVRKKATQIVVSVLGLSALAVVTLTLLAYLPQALSAQRTFAQLPKTTTPQVERHRDKILVSIHSLKRADAFPGKFFMTNRPRDGFTFLMIEMTIRNKSGEVYNVNPFSFKIFMKDGANYPAVLSTTSHPDAIKIKGLDNSNSVRGVIVFQIPTQARPDSLELMGASGTISTVQL